LELKDVTAVEVWEQTFKTTDTNSLSKKIWDGKTLLSELKNLKWQRR
jgi:hypothetical protein